MLRAGFKAWAVASGAALLLVAGAGSASAQTARATSWATCVKKVDGGRKITGDPWVKVKSGCAWTYKVKVVWKAGPDSRCFDLAPGKTATSESIPLATYQGVAYC
ncbi:hypothetical protein [Microtetraspora fusca]|uniref:Secreted protein n=1 Tax=Microtetraspora fusca TaxID=1997 RepID=A0ABW6UXD6_MICFU|nr:hypothetical protein [Microtetraspora fusca]